MTLDEIVKILDETDANFVLLLGHQNTDPDALCSAYALQGLLKALKPRIVFEIGSGQGISRLSKHLLENMPITVNPKPNFESADVIVLVDTNTVQQLGEIAQKVSTSTAPIIVVDHHAAHPETLQKAMLYIANEEASSTCEVVYDLFKQANVKPNLDEAQALFLGIAFDSRHFVLANASTFKTIVDLCEAGINPPETLSMLTLPMELSERIARLKAFQRAKLERIGDWIIMLSNVSAYQASTARALVDLGAHAAAVAGKKQAGIEVSFRCSREFQKATGIHLGKDIAKPLGEALKGMGGGHAAAAGANGTGNVNTALKLCIQLFKDRLLSKNE